MNDLPQTACALFLMFALLLAWILPHSRAALAFTEAEVAFLFPAPISRKTLIHFKLLKSQTAILFSALLMTFDRTRMGQRPSPHSRAGMVGGVFCSEPSFAGQFLRPDHADGPRDFHLETARA